MDWNTTPALIRRNDSFVPTPAPAPTLIATPQLVSSAHPFNVSTLTPTPNLITTTTAPYTGGPGTVPLAPVPSDGGGGGGTETDAFNTLAEAFASALQGAGGGTPAPYVVTDSSEGSGVNIKTVAIVALIGVALFFAWRKWGSSAAAE